MSEEMELLERQAFMDQINNMTHEEMARLSRFAEMGHPFFDSTKPYWTVFNARWKAFGGWNPTLSKKIGWDK